MMRRQRQKERQRKGDREKEGDRKRDKQTNSTTSDHSMKLLRERKQIPKTACRASSGSAAAPAAAAAATAAAATTAAADLEVSHLYSRTSFCMSLPLQQGLATDCPGKCQILAALASVPCCSSNSSSSSTSSRKSSSTCTGQAPAPLRHPTRQLQLRGVKKAPTNGSTHSSSSSSLTRWF